MTSFAWPLASFVMTPKVAPSFLPISGFAMSSSSPITPMRAPRTFFASPFARFAIPMMRWKPPPPGCPSAWRSPARSIAAAISSNWMPPCLDSENTAASASGICSAET
jgi:hypothetical protein